MSLVGVLHRSTGAPAGELLRRLCGSVCWPPPARSAGTSTARTANPAVTTAIDTAVTSSRAPRRLGWPTRPAGTPFASSPGRIALVMRSSTQRFTIRFEHRVRPASLCSGEATMILRFG
jgi:hypothetical protein